MKKLFALVPLFVVAACGPATDVPEPNWASIRDTVFIPSCSCHGGAAPAGNMSLEGDDPSGLVDVDASNFEGYKLIVAGAPEESLVYIRLSGGNDDASAMPPSSGGLDPAVAAAIAEWIENGASD